MTDPYSDPDGPRLGDQRLMSPQDEDWAARDEMLAAGDLDDPALYDPYFDPAPDFDAIDFDDDDYDDGAGWGARTRSAGAGLMDFVRDNPVGASIAAAGIALLFAPRIERDDARDAMDRARSRGRDMMRRGESEARLQAERGRKAGRQAQDRMEREADRLRRRLRSMRDSVDHGTEQMGEEARKRVVAARMRTLAARERALDRADRMRRQARSAADQGAQQMRDTYREHPLLVGTMALALGAALGAAMPRSRMVDNTVGGMSDRLMREAENIYERERARLADAAEGAWAETRAMASETAEAARSSMPDGERTVREAEERLRDGTARLAEAARRGASGRNG